MEKLFYDKQDIHNLLGYSISKSYQIIRELNRQLQEEAKQRNQKIITFPGRIEKKYFEKMVGIEKC